MSLNEGTWSVSSLGHFNPGKQVPEPVQKDAVWYKSEYGCFGYSTDLLHFLGIKI